MRAPRTLQLYTRLALYAAHLASGSTLLCKSVKSGTIAGYLRDVARLLVTFNARDPRRTDATQTTNAECISGVLAEVKRWELVPNCREPLTVDMYMWLHDHVNAPASVHGFDSRYRVVTNWFGKGLYGGYRLTEWAQSVSHRDLNSPVLDIFGDPRAFMLGDLSFRSLARTRLELRAAHHDPNNVGEVTITYRTQKNGSNGEKRSHVRNEHNTKLCDVRLIMEILARFIRLVGWNYTTPLTVYSAGPGLVHYITSTDTELVMRDAAAHVYNLSPRTCQKELQLWSAHSIRVGACFILHVMGFTASQIQFILRWKSMAFLVYLRNLSIMSSQQNKAIHDISRMPNFL
jgi:hypothetical protein